MRKILILLIICILPLLSIAKEFPIDSIVNLNQFKLTNEEKGLLKNNGFVVTPDKHEQLFSLYISNWWNGKPNFVTTDLILQVYHLLFSKTLVRLEYNELYPSLLILSLKMFDKSKKPFLDWYNWFIKNEGEETLSEIDNLQYCDIAYWGIVCRLLGLDVELPLIVDSLCNKEIKLIMKGKGRAHSTIFPFMIDYSQFIPRGHYNSDERLRKFFRAMMWYGLVPYPLEEDKEAVIDENSSQYFMSLSFETSLRLVDDDSLINLWKKIYGVTSAFSGRSNFITPEDVLMVLKKEPLARIRDHKFFDEFSWDNTQYIKYKSAMKKVHPLKIKQKAVGIPTKLQFRFMGQRYLPDSEILQRLTKWSERPFPKGLDVFAALESDRAYQILTDVYKEQNRWKNYSDTLQILRTRFSKLDTSFWFQDIYHAWIYCLLALNEPVSEKHPEFMKTSAWQDKSLNTSLASWSEIRHDVALYGIPIYAEADVPKLTKGYVEPNPEFYVRFLKLLDLTKSKLNEYNLLQKSGQAILFQTEKIDTFHLRETPFATDLRNLTEKELTLGDIVFEFEELIKKLKTIADKELLSKKLNQEEYVLIWAIGDIIEHISAKIVDGRIKGWYNVTGPEKFIACIADVATSLDTCLEVGVGYGNTIYVMVPIEGKWTLTKGAVFSYYEFLHPISDRLTDEKWQEMVRQGKNPAPPIWTKSFLCP